MKYSLRTKHIELTDSDQEQLNKKINFLIKHLTPPYVTDITFTHDKHHIHGRVVQCAITIEQGKKVFHAERQGETIQNALDETIEALRRELKKHHDKKKRHGGGVQR